MHRSRTPLCAALISSVLFAGCSEKDETAPPAPNVDPVVSPTSASTQVITGSAEYGATVTIAGGVATVEVQADPFTALFRAEVELHTEIPAGEVSITNTLTLTATDADGNTSESTTVEIEFGPPPGEATVLTFELTGAAADGMIEAGDDITYTYSAADAYGDPTDDPILVVVNSPDAVVLDDGLSGTGLIIGLARTGSFTVTARVAAGGPIETRTVDVSVASGARFVSLGLTLDRMAINDTVIALVVVRDLFGNPIETPLAEVTIERQDGTLQATDYVQNGFELTITREGVYKLTATFDDGVNPPATAEQYLLVEKVPDLQPPSVAVVAIDGYGVCADGTLRLDAANDCGDPALEPVFHPRQLVEVDVQVDDDRGLSEIAYKAFGNGVTADDFTLLGAGAHTPGTPIVVSFVFRIPSRILPGYANVVARATDSAGNMANSTQARMRLDLGIALSGGRTFESIIGGGLVSAPADIVYNPADGSVVVANRDNADPVVVRVSSSGISSVATFIEPPEALAFDSDGNLFVTLDNVDQVWLVDAALNQTLYQNAPFGNPEGLAVLDGAKPATGRFLFPGAVNDEDCLRLDGVVYEFDSAGGSACAGAGGNCGRAADICVGYDGSQADAQAQLITAVNTNQTAVTAFAGTSCEQTGNDCVYLVANAAGAITRIPLIVDSGNMTATDVDAGEDASLLYVADRAGAQLVYEYQAPADALAGPLNSYDLNHQPRSVAVRMAGGPPARLFVYTVDDGNDDLRQYDTGTGSWKTVARQADGLDQPYDLVITATECVLIANRGSGTIVGIDLTGVAAPEVIAEGLDRPRGLALEGTGPDANLLVVDDGFDLAGRITPTADPTDCF